MLRRRGCHRLCSDGGEPAGYTDDRDVPQLSITLALGLAQSPKAAASFSLTCSFVSVSAKSMKQALLGRDVAGETH